MGENRELRSFSDLVKETSNRFGVSFELTEAIIVFFISELYRTATGRTPKD